VDLNGTIVQRAYRGSDCKCQVKNVKPNRVIVPTPDYSTLQPNSKLSDCNACPATTAPNGLPNN